MTLPRSALLGPSLLLGSLAIHCGPPVATQPAPTPVYTERLNVEPIEIIRESSTEPAPQAAPVAPKEEAPPVTPPLEEGVEASEETEETGDTADEKAVEEPDQADSD